jgi:hypothetical protein
MKPSSAPATRLRCPRLPGRPTGTHPPSTGISIIPVRALPDRATTARLNSGC